MSDTAPPPVAPSATPAPAPAAPAPAPAPVVEATPVATPEAPKAAPMTMAERLKAIEHGKPGFPKPEVQSKPEAVRDEQGRFKAEAGQDAPQATPVAPDTAPAEAPPAEDAKVDDALPSGYVRVEIPEGHPLRERGKTHLTTAEGDAAETRAVLNQWRKNSEIEAAQKAVREAERSRLAAEADAQFWREQGQQFFGPDFDVQYKDIEQAYGKEAAERFKNGVLAEAQTKMMEARTEKVREQELGELQRHAEQFMTLAEQDARSRYPAFFDPYGRPNEAYKRAMASYGAYLNGTGTGELKAADWYRFADMEHNRIPEVQRAMEARQTEERARLAQEAARLAQEQAAAREKQLLEEAAANRRTLPFGGTPRIQRDAAPPSATTAGPLPIAERLRRGGFR